MSHGVLQSITQVLSILWCGYILLFGHPFTVNTYICCLKCYSWYNCFLNANPYVWSQEKLVNFTKWASLNYMPSAASDERTKPSQLWSSTTASIILIGSREINSFWLELFQPQQVIMDWLRCTGMISFICS